MKQKNRIANIVMLAVIVLIAAGCALLAGRHLGWFERDDGAMAVARLDKGTAHYLRDGLGAPLQGELVLRDGDRITVTGGQVTLHAGDSTLTLGEGTELTLECALSRAFTARLAAGEAYADAGETPLRLLWASHDATVQQAVAALSARTGSSSLILLAGQLSVDGTAVAAGESFTSVGADTDKTALPSPDGLSGFFLNCALSSGKSLYFTDFDLQEVIRDRDAQRLASVQDAQPAASGDDPQPSGDDPQPSGETPLPSGNDPLPSHDAPQPSSGGSSQSSGETPQPSGEEPQPTQPEEPPAPAGPTCVIEIRCDTILHNMGDLTAGKDVYVPSNGIILPASTVTFTEGESAFDVLKRVCQLADIQLEYSWTPLYNSYYIEGIHHLYEFDCGPLSGWMYKVNGWFPNYGCSEYRLSDGDAITFCYTCSGLGSDVGGGVG